MIWRLRFCLDRFSSISQAFSSCVPLTKLLSMEVVVMCKTLVNGVRVDRSAARTRRFLVAWLSVRALFLALLISAQPEDAFGQDRRIPESREQITWSFAPLVKRAAPAVVNIFTRKVVRERPMGLFFDDPVFRQFFGGESPFGAPRARVQNSLGSGVIVRSSGVILTNAHVIKDSDEITVVLADKREFEARVIKADERIDLAVLQIDPGGEPLSTLDFMDSDELQVGDLVLAIGNPFGVGQTVTMGIVSAVARTAVGISDYSFFIQTDAAINPGNSGGALISMDGRLAGINTAIFSRSGGSVGIGFAIPSNMARAVLEASATTGGKLVRPWLGITSQAINAELANSLGLSRPEGVLVKAVDARSPAARAGLRVGDVVLTLNGHTIDDPESMRFRAATAQVGSEAVLTTVRNGVAREVRFSLVRAPETPPREASPVTSRSPLLGATVANLSPALADEIDFQGTPQGVVILEMDSRSIAAQLGYRAGDLILRVNEREIGTVRDLLAALRQTSRTWAITVRRGDQVFTNNFRG
ncbi:Periplasmic serine endoprotease DegP-like [Azospirillaceae bacterium]